MTIAQTRVEALQNAYKKAARFGDDLGNEPADFYADELSRFYDAAVQVVEGVEPKVIFPFPGDLVKYEDGSLAFHADAGWIAPDWEMVRLIADEDTMIPAMAVLYPQLSLEERFVRAVFSH